MRKYVLIPLLLCCVALSAAANETSLLSSTIALLKSAEPATLQAYPDANTVLVEDITHLSYNADGSYSYTTENVVKILTEKGRDNQSTVTIGYDAAYGKTRFASAEVIKPDGTTEPIDLAIHSRESIDPSQMSANIYNPNSKRIVLSVPNLGIGDLLRFTIEGERTKAVVPDTWSDVFVFEDTSPILYSLCIVDAPADNPLRRIELKDPVGDTVTYQKEKRADGGTRHIWEAKNVPQLYPEPDMPTQYTVSQRILLSTIPDWEHLSKWYWQLSVPRLNAVNDAMKAHVSELTDGLTTDREKTEAIFRFVSQDIRYMGITVEDEAPGYEPHDVSLTFDNRYGVCRDKAALLVAMLRLAGLDAYPVLIYVGPKKDPEVPQPWFNHAITAVRNPDGSWLLMDPTNENTRDLLPAYLCNRSYLVAHPDGDPLRISPVIPPEDNMLTIQIEGALDDNNLITAQALISFGGINDTATRGRLARLKPEEHKRYFESRLKQALGTARLTDLEVFPTDVRDTSMPLSIALEFEVENAVVEGPEQSILRVPTLINHFGLFGALMGRGTTLDKREYPLLLDITCGVSETIRLNLTPGSLRSSVLPTYETVDTPRVFIRRAISEADGIISASADIRLRTVEFSPDEYLELKDNLETAERNARKRVILQPGGFPEEADFATLSDHTYYALYNPNNYMQVKTVKQKILTYAGKKALSDIKVAYNSGFQKATLNYARVTAPDGTVREIDPDKEINIMDAPWVSKAPRYPAEKIMVVNLPGVEIGSTIEYQIVRSSRGVPFFSVMETFGNFNPIVEKIVETEMPFRAVDLRVGNTAPTIIRRRTSHNDRGNILQKWTARNRPMIRKENQLAPDWHLKPTLFLSAGDMESYAATLRKTMREAATKTRRIKSKAKELTKGIRGRIPKIAALRDFVDRNIRPAGPGIASLPLSAITPAEQTLAEGYGNAADRAVLLYALANAAKLKPRFVLSSNLPEKEGLSTPLTTIFQRQPFRVPLVAIEDDDQIYYFGDSGRYAVPGTLAHTRNPAINLDNGELETPDTTLTNRTDTSYRLLIADNGDVTIYESTHYSGTWFEHFHKRFAEFTPEERRREHQRILSNLSQSAEPIGPLMTSFTQNTLSLAAHLPGYATIDGDYMYLTLPHSLGHIFSIQSDQRFSPFYIDDTFHTTITCELSIPEGWGPALIPQAFETELPAGGGTVSTRLIPNRNTLTIVQSADIQPAIIPVDQFDELLDINDRITRPAARTILLKRIPTKK